MADYKLDTFLKTELNNGKIKRLTIDFQAKTITLWHDSIELNEEIERQVQKTTTVACRPFSSQVKADYAFNMDFITEFMGAFMLANQVGGEGNFKTTIHYDVNQNTKFGDM